MRVENIRNFCIIAHIDHGKSTLADRLLQQVGAVDPRKFRDQMLDNMDLERERGITIKASAVTLNYQHNGQHYELNLIDTPGHVDFNYEVSRSLTACEGALLVVDAAQGVEAQTVANLYLAIAQDLTIIPIINKVDLQQAQPMETIEEMEKTFGTDPADAIQVSAKTGMGIEQILKAVVERIPPPQGEPEAQLRALIFDSEYNEYRGVIVYVRVYDGEVHAGMKMYMMKTGTTYEVTEVGQFTPGMSAVEKLQAGEVGYIISNIKTIQDVSIGDTITDSKESKVEAMPGYQEPKPMVFCGLYPAVNSDVQSLREALERLRLNDTSFTFEPETSQALGLGFRCGFLGLLHMEIIQERLERESDVQLVQTAPNVTYEVVTVNDEVIRVDNPAELPDANKIEEFREPVVRLDIIVPSSSVGAIMQLAEERRGTYVKTEYISQTKVNLEYEVPLAEIVYDFYDKLKSATRGYGTMDYEVIGYRPAKLVKLDILVAGEVVDALSTIVAREKAEAVGRRLVTKLRKKIARHLFEIAIQAAVGSRIIARETIRPLLKNVTGKCYGGDITRKRKLWDKQKAGKKRMKQVGRVAIPQEAFLAVLEED